MAKSSVCSYQQTEKAGRLRGFAFVEMGTEVEEAAAIEALNGAVRMGCALEIN